MHNGIGHYDKIQEMVDRAAALKWEETRLASERHELEEKIAALTMGGDSTIRLYGASACAIVQQKTKDTWKPEVCKALAGRIHPEQFHKLFKVTFAGQKRELGKFMMTCEDVTIRAMINDACASEPTKPYIKYELTTGEDAA
jgi:hypothetical protein